MKSRTTENIKNKLKQLDSIELPEKDKMLSRSIDELHNQGLLEKTIFIKKKKQYRFALASGIATLVIFLAIISYGIVVEAKEYNNAIDFFNEYNLSTDGLTRSEIKNIYRDIETGKFSYDKTAEVIKDRVNGYEIFQDEPTPENLKKMWESTKSIVCEYNYDSIYRHNDEGYDEFEKNVFYKNYEGDKVWSVDIYNILIYGYIVKDEMILIYGTEHDSLTSSYNASRIVKIKTDGEVVFDITMTNGFESEEILRVLFDDENNIIVFSRGDYSKLCISKYNKSGEQVSFICHEVGRFITLNAIKMEKGYLVHLSDYGKIDDVLMKINEDGTLSEAFTYESDDVDYYINEMIEFNGDILLSANVVPKYDTSINGYKNDASTIFDKDLFSLSDEELTKIVRDNYTAVLLICNKETGQPKEFYSVKGSLGAELSVENGKLIWKVECICNTYFSPETSSFCIGGESRVYKYTFDSLGKLISQEKTEEVVAFRR